MEPGVDANVRQRPDSSLVTVDRLSENLQRYTNEIMAARIRQAPLEKIQLRPCRSGATGMRFLNVPLCSEVDPLREAELWASRIQLEDLDRLVILGLGMGYHLEALRRRTDLPIHVVEPSPSVIRATLGSRNLGVERAEIVDSPGALQRILSNKLQLAERVGILAWPLYARIFPEVLVAVKRAVSNSAKISGVSARTLSVRLPKWIDHTLTNVWNSVGRVSGHRLLASMQDRPVIVVAAGPSLDKNVHWLKEVGDRAMIVAVNTSLGALERAGVKAHLVVCIEALNMESQFESLQLNRNCPRALAFSAFPGLFTGATGAVYPCVEEFSFYNGFQEHMGLAAAMQPGGSVANSAFSLACNTGTKRVILAGQDLAFTGGNVYASGTVFEKMRIEQLGQGGIRLTNLEAKQRIAASCPQIDNTRAREETLLTTAWGGGQVQTSPAFNCFRNVFESWALRTPDIEFINATEGGARIDGFSEQPLENVVKGLPDQPPLELPQGPAISEEQVVHFLQQEKRQGEGAMAIIRSLTRESSDAQFVRLKEAVHQAGLFNGYVWPIFGNAMHNDACDFDAVFSQLRESGESFLSRIEQSLSKKS